MMKKLLALFLALFMCLSLTSVFAEEVLEDTEEVVEDTEEEPEIEEEEHVVEVIEETIESDSVYIFDENKLNQICIDETGNRLEYIKIDTDSFDTSAGTLLYDYDGTKPLDVTSSTPYYREKSGTKKLISSVAFVPKYSFSGEVEIIYTAYDKRSNTRDPYQTFEGKIVITVTESVSGGDIDVIKLEAKKGGRYRFDIADFEKEFKNAGVSMNYMKFTLPEATDGKLYYNYSATSTGSSYNKAVTESTAYYLEPKTTKQLDFSKVTILFADTADDRVDLEYTVYDQDDEPHDGVVSFRMEDTESYSTTYEAKGESVFLRASDFNAECIENTGARLRYVKFSKPSSGALWYDYDNEEDARAQLSTTKAYYYNSDPYINLIAYVPKDNYKGTVYIDYIGTSISNETYNGTITIKVDTKNIDEADTISYSVKNTAYKTLAPSTFATECKEVTGETLDYIKFTAPSKGKLYYKYNKSGEYDVTSSDRFYYKSADGDYLGYVTYVPQKSYTGTVSISYTGMTTEGTLYKGIIKMTVTGTTESSSKDEVSDIKYSGKVGQAIEFDADDFYDVCDDYTNDDLEFVVFTVPSNSVGIMYYDYEGDDEEKISAADEIYYEDDEPLLSKISFVPAKSGTISIKYKAYPYDEDDYVGYVKLTVTGGSSTEKPADNNMANFKKSKNYKKGMFFDVDENAWYGANVNGTIKSAYSYGLMQGRADGSFDPTGNMTVAEAITIAARIGDIYFGDNTKFGSGNENWYDDYVDYAIKYKIIRKNQFSDYNAKITREEMAKIFANILPEEAMEEINDIEEIPDVSEDDEYFEEIIFLYRVGILLGDEKGAFNPKNYITRAEVSAMITRIVDVNERLEN